MIMLRCVAFLFLITLLGNGQVQREHHQTDLSSQAEIPVRRLYQQLVSQPIGGGIPTPKRMKSLSPLSQQLTAPQDYPNACLW